MEVGQGPNWGCTAKEKSRPRRFLRYCYYLQLQLSYYIAVYYHSLIPRHYILGNMAWELSCPWGVRLGSEADR
jgi:hypothetical protein